MMNNKTQQTSVDLDEVMETVVTMNGEYHDLMQKAQKTWNGGIPLEILAYFMAVQINLIISRNSEFELLLVDALIRQKEKS